MTGALFYVAATSAKNRIVMWMRKLRNVRYLVSAVFGLAYIFFMFGRSMMLGSHKMRLVFVADSLGADITAGIVFVLMISAFAWPSSEGVLS